jgi:hypothetical protein
MIIDLGITFNGTPPNFPCTRSQGSKGDPSARVHCTYRSKGVKRITSPID